MGGNQKRSANNDESTEEVNLVDLLKQMAGEILHGENRDGSIVQRIRTAMLERAPRFKQAARNVSADIMRWMHKGGAWRAFLVTTVGIITFLALAAMTTFMLFFITATANALAIALLMSISGVGAFIGVFFMLLTAIYIVALIIAAIAISTITFCTITAVIFTTGWIAFWWLLWQCGKKSLHAVRHLVATTLSTLSAAGSTQIIAIEKGTF